MKLYEAIFYGLVTYAGVAGFLWFTLRTRQFAPPEAPSYWSITRGPEFSKLSREGRVSFFCGILSLLVMFGGMMLLFGLAVTIPPQHGPYAVSSSPSAQRH